MKSHQMLKVLMVLTTICLTFAEESKSQSSVDISLNVSTEMQSDVSSPDLQSELEIGYSNKFFQLNDNMYIYGKVAGFYQLENLSRNYSQALDAPQYDYNRYGGSFATGLLAKGAVINASFGIGLTHHRVVQNKTQEGMLPPGSTSTSPDQIKGSFNTFDINIALSRSILSNIDLQMGLRVQSPIDQNRYNNHRVSPRIGLQYSF
jgi:hypothetical protein